MYLIGIDVGTTHTKIGIYRPSGKLISFRKIQTPLKKTETGGELYGDILFSAILDILREFYESSPQLKKEKGYLGVSSLGETVIPVSQEGKTLSPGLIWYDRRTVSIYKRIIEEIGKDYFIERLLKNPGYFYSINKIVWLRDKYPELFNKIRWFLPVSSYIAFSFTHTACIDYSHAVRTMVFDPHTMDWDRRVLEKLNIDPEIFPPLCESGVAIETVPADVKEYLGISGDIVVSSGGHDHLVAALSMGLFEKNILFNSSGTTESIFLGLRREELLKKDVSSFLSYGDITCHTVIDLCTAIASMGTGGIAFEWFIRRILGRDLSYIEDLSYKRNDVFFMPRVLEVHGGSPQSAFLALGMEDDLTSLYSALMESLVFEIFDRTKALHKIEEELPSTMRISGGPSQNSIYNQLKSDLFQKRIEIPKNREATLFGAALLGGIGGGVYKGYREAHEETYEVEEVYYPTDNPYLFEKFERYKEFRKRYSKFLLED